MAAAKQTDRIKSSELPEIDKNIKRTVRRQIVDNIIFCIQNGSFTEGQRLPTLEDPSFEYDVSTDTIVKSYIELKRRGFIVSYPERDIILQDSLQLAAQIDLF